MDSHLARARVAYLDSCDGPVIWGVSDCATSAAASIEAATGFDPWRFFRGRYQDRESLHWISGVPVGLLLRRIARAHKWERTQTLKGLCIGLVRTPEGHGVVMGFEHPKPVWIGRGGEGAVVLHDPKIIRAWRVC